MGSELQESRRLKRRRAWPRVDVTFQAALGVANSAGLVQQHPQRDAPGVRPVRYGIAERVVELQLAFLRLFDLGYQERRLRFVTSALRWWYRDLAAGKSDIPPRADLDRGKQILYDAVTTLRRTMGGENDSPPRELARFVRAQRDMLDRLSAGVAQFGRDRSLIFFNQPFARLFSLTPDFLAIKERCLDLLSANAPAATPMNQAA